MLKFLPCVKVEALKIGQVLVEDPQGIWIQCCTPAEVQGYDIAEGQVQGAKLGRQDLFRGPQPDSCSMDCSLEVFVNQAQAGKISRGDQLCNSGEKLRLQRFNRGRPCDIIT